jgi:hypothetical protein
MQIDFPFDAAESEGSNLPALPLPDENQIANSFVAIYKKLGGTVSSSALEVIAKILLNTSTLRLMRGRHFGSLIHPH